MTSSVTAPTGFPRPPAVAEAAWSPWRWMLALILAFVGHVALIFIFGRHEPISPRPVKNAVQAGVILQRTELMDLQDPMVFAGPHPRGFAASTWLAMPTVPLPSFRWTDGPHFLALAAEQLGVSFSMQAVAPPADLSRRSPSPPPDFAVLLPPAPPAPPTQSVVRITGALAGWPLVADWPLLPVQSSPESLTNSVVQVVVDEAGRVFSAVLLPPGSGSVEADQQALRLAHAARFTPPPGQPAIQFGRIVFQWQSRAPATGTTPPP